jgi:hypothetical protein
LRRSSPEAAIRKRTSENLSFFFEYTLFGIAPHGRIAATGITLLSANT